MWTDLVEKGDCRVGIVNAERHGLFTAEEELAQLKKHLSAERAKSARLEGELAAEQAENAQLRQMLEEVLRRLREVEGQLAKDSPNSSKPPSSDGLGRKRVNLRVTVIGDMRIAVYDDTNPAEMIKIYNKGADVHVDPVVSYRFGTITIPHIDWIEQLRLEWEDFAHAIRAGIQPCAHSSVGLEVGGVLAAAQEVLEEQER
jgi:uncharacterized coiled-coil protein SlyX